MRHNQRRLRLGLALVLATALDTRALGVPRIVVRKSSPPPVVPQLRCGGKGCISTPRAAASPDAAEPGNDVSSLPVLLQKPMRAAVWSVAWPTLVIGILRTLYGLTDAFWVGKLGPVELEAIGATSFATWMVLIAGELASIGVHAIASVHEGSSRRDLAGDTVVQGLWASFFSSLVVATTLPLVGAYFALLGLGGPAAAAVREAGTSYLQWTIAGALPLTAAGVAAAGFKGIGDTKPALYMTAASVALNAVIDPILIWGPGPFPRLGVAGAAIATNISSLFALVLLLRRLGKSGVPLRWQGPNWSKLKDICKIGAPMAASGMLFTAVYLGLGRILTGLGDANLGALGLGHRLESLAYTVNEAFGAAAATVVGQWLGAGDKSRARRAAATSARLCAFVALPFVFLALVATKPIIHLFSSDPAVVAATESYLRIVALVFPFSAIETTYEGALAGAADTLPTFLAGLLLNTARVPLAIWLSGRFGVEGVWLAIAGTTVVKAVVKQLAFRWSRLPACAPDADQCIPVLT